MTTRGAAKTRQAGEALPDFLSGTGEMGTRVRALDWAATTPLGPISAWPQSLKASLSICLHSRFPMVIWWGAELTLLYNDAWRPMLGETKHPRALGRPGAEIWPEIWPIIGEQLKSVVNTGQATWSDDTLLVVDRNHFTEEAYFTYSYSPILLEDGSVGGVFTAVSETTERVIAARRLETLRLLAARTAEAQSVDDAWRFCAEALSANPSDIPFALLYAINPDAESARLVETVGLAEGSSAVPKVVSLVSEELWPFSTVAKTGEVQTVDNLIERFGQLHAGRWPAALQSAVIFPLASAGQTLLAGIAVIGVSPYRPLNNDYRAFLHLTIGHIATAVSNAHAYESERRRAEALADLDRAKTTFFSNVSHEFRTPLTLMLGPLEGLLAKSGDLPVQDRQHLEIAYRNSLRLLRLVNSLLDFSRMEAGRAKAIYAPVNLSELTVDLASNFRSAIEAAGLELVVDCEPLSQPVYADREMWEKIVLNLLSNAFKFTFEGRVSVKLHADQTNIHLTVADTGTGIPEAELPHLFERFHRVEGAKGRTYEGTGIGLALVQDLVKLHGGTIAAISKVGEGSSFTVSLPLGTAYLPKEQVQCQQPLSTSRLRAEGFIGEALTWGSASADFAPSGDAPAKEQARILIADDNADMREHIRRILSRKYEVVAAADGQQALDLTLQHPPDLVLTDVMMPRLNGFDLLRALRANAATEAIPVIFLSARAGEEASAEGLKAGAADYLVKPFTAKELESRVGSHVDMVRMRRRAAEREVALRAEAEAARDEAKRVLESITDGFFAMDREGRLTYVNAEAERLNGMRREDMLGKTFWDLFPEAVGTPIHQEFARAVEERVPVEFDHHYVPWDRWFHAKIYPVANGGFSVFYQDISDRKRAEAECSQALALLTTILDSSPDVIAAKDSEGRYLVLNEAASRLIGRPVPELLGLTDLEMTRQEVAERIMATDMEVIRTGKAVSVEEQYPDPSGKVHYFQSIKAPLRGDGAAGVVVVSRDITAQRQTEEALEHQLRLTNAITSNAAVSLFLLDEHQQCMFLNPSAEKLTGFSLDELRGQTLHGAIHHTRPDGSPYPLSECPIDQAFTNQQRTQGEEVFVHKDGSFYPVVYSASPLLAGTAVIGTIIEMQDISERKRAEEALRRALHFDEAVMGSMGEGLYTVDVDGLVVTMNPAAEKLFGWTLAELRGKNMHDATHYKHPNGLPFPVEDCAGHQVLGRGNALTNHEDVFIRKDETFFDVVYSSSPIREGDTVTGLVVVFRDVTERKKATSALDASEARFRAAVKAHSSIIWTNNAQGEMEGEQPSWSAFTGQSRDEYQGFGWSKAVHPDDAQPTIDAWNMAVTERRLFAFEHRLRRNDGTWRLFSIRAAPVFDEQGNIREWVGVHDDITDERNLLIALRESETRFRELAELGPQFIWVAHPNGTLEYVNERWTSYSGLDFKATADADRLTRIFHPDDQKEMARRWQQALATGEPFENEARLRRADGEYRWFVIRSVPLEDEFGVVTKWFGASTDIHEQKRVQEELRRANQDLEQFAYSASHDLQEPLRSVSIYSELLAQRYGGDLNGQALEFLEYLKSGASRMQLLIRDLLAYTQVSKMESPVEECDAATALSSVLTDLKEAIAESGAQIDSGSLPRLRVHKVHLRQLFQNLIGNALKYRDGAQPIVFVEARQENGYWLFSVRDNGIGIDPEYKERIFGLFKRLHTGEHYAGTGLGLAICQRIVERYHGRIWVESRLGEGSTFYFTLLG